MEYVEDSAQRNIEELTSAANEIRKLSETISPPPPLSEEDTRSCITTEVSQGGIVLDKDCLAPCGRDLILARVREYLYDFVVVRRKFSDRFQYFEKLITDANAIPGRIANLEKDRDKKIAAAQQSFENDTVVEVYRQRKSSFDRQVEIHPHQPNMKSVSDKFIFDVNPYYLLMMAFLGIAEWFINYDTLFLFFGIPVIAVGATFILAVCLSMIAHQHGLDIKQWKKKFGPAVERKNRPLGIVILATFGLVALLTVTGWMRYQAVMGALQTQTTANILGTQYSVRIDPQREVIISLGANLLAWLVGVFVSYFAHDADPVYVQTALDFKKAEKKYLKLLDSFKKTASQISHYCAEEVENEKNREKKFESNPFLRQALQLRNQVEQYDLSFRERAMSYIVTQYAKYRNELIKNISKDSTVELFKSTGNGASRITITDFRSIEIGLSEDVFGHITTNGAEA